MTGSLAPDPCTVNAGFFSRKKDLVHIVEVGLSLGEHIVSALVFDFPLPNCAGLLTDI